MAKGIVYIFKMVYIHHKTSNMIVMTFCQRNMHTYVVIKISSIIEPGQFVCDRQLLQQGVFLLQVFLEFCKLDKNMHPCHKLMTVKRLYYIIAHPYLYTLY